MKKDVINIISMNGDKNINIFLKRSALLENLFSIGISELDFLFKNHNATIEPNHIVAEKA